MHRLLMADMRRLIRSPLSWGTVVLMMLASAGFVFMQTIAAREVGIERVILLFMSVYGIAAAMVLGLLHGSEYREGTLRNKLVCGCSRIQVYFSHTVISMIVCMVMYLAALLTAIVLGAPLFDLHVSVRHEMLAAVMGLMCCIYYAALYTMVPTLCSGRTAAVAVNMATAVGMLMLSVSISEMASEDSEFWRVVLEAIPTGQAILVNEAEIDVPVRMALLDVFGTATCTCAGAYALCSKEIR